MMDEGARTSCADQVLGSVYGRDDGDAEMIKKTIIT
jgi:hypothetical protein